MGQFQLISLCIGPHRFNLQQIRKKGKLIRQIDCRKSNKCNGGFRVALYTVLPLGSYDAVVDLSFPVNKAFSFSCVGNVFPQVLNMYNTTFTFVIQR